MKLFNSEYDLL